MHKFTLTAFSAACCLAMAGGAIGANMSKSDYNANMTTVKSTYTTELAACKPLAGNAKDICDAEAKGRENVAKADLEASYQPSEKHAYGARLARADAAHAVAKEKCDDFAGNAKDVCVKEAKAGYVSAKANAKVAEAVSDAKTTAREKTNDANATAQAKTVEAVKDANAEKRDAGYAVAKEKCDALAGDAKAGCIRDAKARYGQS